MQKLEMKATISQQGYYTEQDRNLIQNIEQMFVSEHISTKHRIMETVTKSTDPLVVTLIISAVVISLEQIYINHVHNKIENKIKNLIASWKDTFAQRSIHKPMYFRVEIDGVLTISTYPYLFNDDWIENFPQKLINILNVIKSNPELHSATEIRLVSLSIDEVHVVVWCDRGKPKYVIDLTRMQIISANEDYVKEIQDTGVLATVMDFGKLDSDSLSGIAILANDEYVAEWTKSQLLKSKLQDEIIKRVNQIRENNTD